MSRPFGLICYIYIGDCMKTRLRDLREDHDITQEEAAKIAYISKKTYERYENGERTPTLDTIKAFAEYYEVSIDYIAYLTNISTPYKRKQKNTEV